MSKEFEALLTDFTRVIGIGDGYEPTNPASFTIEDLDIVLEEQGDVHGGMVVLYSMLGIAPEEHELTACRAMLEANFLWSGTGDATLGMNSDTREVVLACQFPTMGMNGEGLMTLVEHFIVVADIWRHYLKDLAAAGTPSSAPEPPKGAGENVIYG